MVTDCHFGIFEVEIGKLHVIDQFELCSKTLKKCGKKFKKGLVVWAFFKKQKNPHHCFYWAFQISPLLSWNNGFIFMNMSSLYTVVRLCVIFHYSHAVGPECPPDPNITFSRRHIWCTCSTNNGEQVILKAPLGGNDVESPESRALFLPQPTVFGGRLRKAISFWILCEVFLLHAAATFMLRITVWGEGGRPLRILLAREYLNAFNTQTMNYLNRSRETVFPSTLVYPLLLKVRFHCSTIILFPLHNSHNVFQRQKYLSVGAPRKIFYQLKAV